MRTVTSKKIHTGRYKVIDKNTKEHLGFVDQCYDTKLWFVQDVDGNGHDCADTKREAMWCFEYAE